MERHAVSRMFKGVQEGGDQDTHADGQQDNNDPGENSCMTIPDQTAVGNAGVKSQIADKQTGEGGAKRQKGIKAGPLPSVASL